MFKNINFVNNLKKSSIAASILVALNLVSLDVVASTDVKSNNSSNSLASEQMLSSAKEVSLSLFNNLPESRVTKMRESYAKAVKAYKNGNEALGLEIQQTELKDYPLNVWLDYYRLAYNIDLEHFDEALNFIKTSNHTELSNLLKDKYIKYLSDNKDYMHLSLMVGEKPFNENQFSTLSFSQKQEMCRFYEANWPLDKVNEDAIAFATRVYLDLSTPPSACNNLLSLFEKKGYLNNVLRLKRFEKAYARQSYQETTKDLVKDLNNSQFRDRVKAQMALYDNPSDLFSLDVRKDTLASLAQKADGKAPSTKTKAKNISFESNADDIRRVAVLAFKRYANLSPRSARADLNSFKKKFSPSDTDMIEIYQSFARSFLSRSYDEADVDWVDSNLPTLAWSNDLKEQRLRRAIYFAQWDKAYLLIDHLPKDVKSKINWRYWKGRSALELGRKDEGQAILTEVAQDRSFFGFYAAQVLDKEYPFNYVKIDPKYTFPLTISNNKSAIRFLELYAMDDEDAIYEWREIAKKSPENEAMTMAQWALQTGNVSYAIDYVVSSKHWDALDYRFPVAYKDFYEKYAAESNVSLSFLYGISRQESMLNPKIRSWAGAVGLMQLMPSTAKDIARNKRWTYEGSYSLTDPETNIKYGSTYLSWMLDKFSNNRVLAAAAYNAGPGRIPQWESKDGKVRDVAMYVESIPFSETRQYVQNVLLYDSIYNFLLTGKKKDLLNQNEFSYKY